MSALVSSIDRPDDDVFGGIADAVQQHGYAVIDGALPAGLVDALFVCVRGLRDGELARAGIGRDDDHRLNRFVRSDEIHWLEPGDTAGGAFLAWMERLRLGINRHLFLGLFDYEAHYARYLPGALYRRHRDAFGDDTANRVLSTVLYLNPNWCADDGGEMLLYGDDGDRVVAAVPPVYGRLAVFLSAHFPHEVLMTRSTRFSIAGWFRVNATLGGRIDPPR